MVSSLRATEQEYLARMDGAADIPEPDLGEAAELALRDLRRPSLAPIRVACAAALTDLPVLAIALWFAQYASIPDADFSALSAALIAIAAASLVVGLLLATSSYSIRNLRSPLRALARVGAAASVAAGLLSLVLSLAPGRIELAGLACIFAAAAPLRLSMAAVIDWLQTMRLLDRRAVIAGGGEHAETLIRGLAKIPNCEVRIFGIFDDRDDLRSPQQVLGAPKLGGYRDLIAFARRAEIDMVIVALPLEAEGRISWLLEKLRVLPVEVRLSAFSRNYAFGAPRGGALISAVRHSFAPECRLTKRLFDILFASLALLLASPAMLAAAVAIRLDSPGPVLFRQRRHGYNDRVIEVLKFRTLRHETADPDARRVVTRGDPRITRVGGILRRSSIDELPQLINVLRGDLSLVGPRPHAVDAVSSRQESFARMVEGYSARHRLPPGITGWAQVNGWRGEIDDPDKLRARFEHDLHYIENWSVWLDLKILLRTPFSLLDTRSAY